MRLSATRARSSSTVRPQFLDRAFVDHATACHHADAIGERLGLLQIMRGEQHRTAFGEQLADRRPQLLPRLDIHADRGLVQEQQLGPATQCQRELHPPLLPAGQFRVGTLEQIADAGQFGGFRHRAWRRVVAGGQSQQLAHPQRRRQLGVLQHDADAPARLDLLRVLAEQLNRAGVGAEQPQQQADGGGFAGSIGAQQGQQFSALQLQVGAIQRGERAIALDGAVEAGDRFVVVRHG